MSVNDRGSIKWTAMMMSEHHQLLRQMWKQQEYKAKPELDEQQIEEINMKLQIVIDNDLSVIVKYYGDHAYKRVRGKLNQIHVVQKCLQLDDGNNIEMNNIIDVIID